MSRPIVVEGIVNGNTITLDEKTFLPDGYRVTLHVILEKEEAARLAVGSWANMSKEEEAELQEILSDLHGRPVDISIPDEER
jgi:hypothetical protein